MDKNFVIVPVLTTETLVLSMEMFLVNMGIFQSGGINIVLI